MAAKFMIHLQGATYSNELYKYPAMEGKHIYNLQEAIAQAKLSFPKCTWTVYNGEESFCNENEK